MKRLACGPYKALRICSRSSQSAENIHPDVIGLQMLKKSVWRRASKGAGCAAEGTCCIIRPGRSERVVSGHRPRPASPTPRWKPTSDPQGREELHCLPLFPKPMGSYPTYVDQDSRNFRTGIDPRAVKGADRTAVLPTVPDRLTTCDSRR